jgi:iron complex transport system substrate-binding protein
VSRVSVANGAGLLLALAVSVGAAGGRERTGAAAAREALRPATITDATGAAVPVRAYRRIASGSTVADRLLVDLCDRRRVVAFTAASAEGPDAARYRAEGTVASIDDLEEILALRPDLVLVQNVAAARRVERLRDAGLTVFDLGPSEGLRSLHEDARQVAALCGAPERGARYARRLARRMEAVAADVPPAQRRAAIYLTIYGDRLFGGTLGTSFHDVLTAAGLRDAAAGRHRGWPQYSVEEVLELDPELVVTRTSMGDAICGHSTLARLRACDGGVVEVDGALLSDPGPGMLEAARAVHAAVYGE